MSKKFYYEAPFDPSYDDYLLKLRREKAQISWRQTADQMSERFSRIFSLNDLVSRYEKITARVGKEEAQAIFEEFLRFELDFRSISKSTGKTINQVKKEIISIIANNVWKFIFLARKREISLLKINIITNQNIKELVVMMLRPEHFRLIKRQYQMVWKFVFRNFSDFHFSKFTDSQFLGIYREVIMLIQKFKIGYELPQAYLKEFTNIRKDKDIKEGDLQRRIFSECVHDRFDEYKKKQQKKEVICLLSEDELSEPQEIKIEPDQSTPHPEPQQVNLIQLVRQIITSQAKLKQIGQVSKQSSETLEVLKETIKLTLMKALLRGGMQPSA